MDYDFYLFYFSVIAFLFGVVVNIVYAYEDNWLESLVLVFGLMAVSGLVFVCCQFFYAFGAISEYDVVKENGRTYVLAGESLGFDDYFRHKYEVVSKYLRKDSQLTMMLISLASALTMANLTKIIMAQNEEVIVKSYNYLYKIHILQL